VRQIPAYIYVYWVKGAALIFRFWATVLGRPSHLSWKEAGIFAAGLAASCACILVALWLAHTVVGINGKG